MPERSHAARILLAEDSAPMIAALRRALQGEGYEVDVIALAAGVPALPPRPYAAALVHGGRLGAELVKALRDLDPHLPILEVYLDDEEAQEVGGLEVDGTLVGPLSPAAVRGAVRMASRLGRASRWAGELEAVAARRVDSAQELAFLKRMLLLEVKRSKRYSYPVALALFAVDGWAEVSARLPAHGRAALLGDLLAVLSSSLRDIDLAVPFGEDRLVVLMPHTRTEGALRVASRLVARIRDSDRVARVTVSAGVAAHPGGGTVSFGSLVKHAAAALSAARAAGGDRAEAADPPPRRSRVSMG